MEIEVSVLGPLQAVTDAAEIEVGRDGLVVEDGWHARAAAAAGRGRMEMGSRRPSRADLPQGGPARGCVEAWRPPLAIRSRGLRRRELARYRPPSVCDTTFPAG